MKALTVLNLAAILTLAGSVTASASAFNANTNSQPFTTAQSERVIKMPRLPNPDCPPWMKYNCIPPWLISNVDLRAQNRINSDEILRNAFVAAVESNDRVQLSRLLVQAGFTSEQVRSATLFVRDDTRGTNTNLMRHKPKKVEIYVRFKPLEFGVRITW